MAAHNGSRTTAQLSAEKVTMQIIAERGESRVSQLGSTPSVTPAR
jgi:hypothetical protein